MKGGIDPDFEWDERKRKANIEKHKVDFVYAALIFENAVLTKRDDRNDYGEPRYIAIGLVDEACFVVVYTLREPNIIRLISAWKGGTDERETYQKSIPERDSQNEEPG